MSEHTPKASGAEQVQEMHKLDGEREDEFGYFELGRSFNEEYERLFKQGSFDGFICCDSPVEILIHLINERDEARAATPAPVMPVGPEMIDLRSALQLLGSLDRIADDFRSVEPCRHNNDNLVSDLKIELAGLRSALVPIAEKGEDWLPIETARPIDEYHEDMGDVLWWKFPVCEPPYIGSPNDIGFTVQADIEITLRTHADPAGIDGTTTIKRDVGGWPGYHTHFTPIHLPAPPLSHQSKEG